MKKALLLSAVLLLAASALRAAPANANFSSEWGVPFQLIFDGQPLTRPGARTVHIDRLTPGFHWAEFLIPAGYGRVTTLRTRVLLDGGLETSYVLLARPGYGVQLRKVAVVPIRRGYGLGESMPYPPAYPAPNGSYNNGYGNYPNGAVPAPNGSYPPATSNNYPPAPGAYPPSGDYSPNAPAPAPYPNGGYAAPNGRRYRPLAPQEVDDLLQTMQNTTLEEEKLTAARQALAQATIPTDELVRLLSGLTMEGTRLELAKLAYAHVADPQNFGRVYDAFEFEASVEELQRYVQQQRQPR